MRNLEISVLSACLALALAGCGEVNGGGVGADADQGNPASSPAVTSVLPERGALAGGDTVSIFGTGFVAGTRVVIGGLEAELTVDSETELSVTTPAGAVANISVDVLLFNDNGLTQLADGFTYNRPPTATSISPRYGNIAGRSIITVTGTGLMVDNPGIPTVTVGGVAASDVSVVDDQSLTFALPTVNDAEIGVPKSVVVTTANGEISFEGFFYTRKGLLVGMRSRDGRASSRGVYYVDPARGVAVSVLDGDAFPFGISRLALSPTGELFALGNRQTVLERSLTKLDLVGGTYEYIGRTGTGQSVKGAAFNGAVLYTTTRSGDNLNRVDAATGELTPVSNPVVALPGNSSKCLTRRDDNSLWHIGRFNGPLSVVNTATGVAATQVTLGQSIEWRCHGLTTLGTTLYAVVQDRTDGSELAAKLVSIVPSTGQVTDLMVLPDGAAGLAVTPEGF